MALIIQDRSRDGKFDRVLTLTNGEISRTMVPGECCWNCLRLAIRFQISQSISKSALITSEFEFGLCSTITGSYSSSASHFIGAALQGKNISVYSYDNGLYNFPSSGVQIIKKLGTARTNYFPDPGGNRKYFVGTFSESIYRKGMIFVDISKSLSDPGVWNVSWYGRHFDYAGATVDNMVDARTFYSYIAGPVPVTGLPTSYYEQVIKNISIPVSESVDGKLDTINIYYTSSNSSLDISDIAVWRVS